MRRRRRKSDCPVHFALEVFGDAWTLLIIRDVMFKGRTTYTDFLRAEEGIATNVLADRLAHLEEDGIIEKDARPSGRGTNRYRLTAKGIDLLPVMLDIIGWSAKYDPKTAVDVLPSTGEMHRFTPVHSCAQPPVAPRFTLGMHKAGCAPDLHTVCVRE